MVATHIEQLMVLSDRVTIRHACNVIRNCACLQGHLIAPIVRRQEPGILNERDEQITYDPPGLGRHAHDLVVTIQMIHEAFFQRIGFLTDRV